MLAPASSTTLLVTGGTGFIGSHTCVLLLQAGYQIIILDNLSNSQISVLNAIEKITQCRPIFIQGDIRDTDLLNRIFQTYQITAVLHFAGKKAVGESVKNPLKYYDNNVVGSLQIIRAMQKAKVSKLIFSSSATVYGDPKFLPITEQHPLRATNPYGQSKLVTEQLLKDWHHSQKPTSISCLRYFNPVGAHPSGLLGENPKGIPNNLMPFLMQVATGKKDKLAIFGNDYATSDGTGIRDYLHVMDLAQGHVLALKKILRQEHLFLTLNLGTGIGYSVLEMLKTAELASGKTLRYEFTARRDGDVAACWADPQLAYEELGWKARYDLKKMCKDTWNWAQQTLDH